MQALGILVCSKNESFIMEAKFNVLTVSCDRNSKVILEYI